MVKNLPANAGDPRYVGSIPGLGRSPGVGTGNPRQYSCLESPWIEQPGGLHSMGVTKDWSKRTKWAYAAAAAKSLQSCLTLCNPIDGSPPGSSVPGILQARILEWVAISFSSAWKWKVEVKSLRHSQLLATPWTGAYQAPPSMGFSRQEYWSGVPLPSPVSIWAYCNNNNNNRRAAGILGPWNQRELGLTPVLSFNPGFNHLLAVGSCISHFTSMSF